MNTSFEKTANTTDEWYTPKEIIDALGKFDLDPCAPLNPLWRTAVVMYDKNIDGLSRKWEGRVWFNPPYSKPLFDKFIKRMIEHDNGILLTFNRCDTKIFQEHIFYTAKAMLFIKGRIKFFTPDGNQTGTPGCGSVLIAFGENNAEILRTCNIAGKYVRIN